MNLADDQVEDLLGKGDDDTARKGQETVRSLRRIVGLQGQTDLHDAEAQQDKPDGTDQTEDKGGQVIDNGNGVAGSKSRDRSTEDECRTHNSGAVNAEALLDLAGHRQLGGVLVGFLKEPLI